MNVRAGVAICMDLNPHEFTAPFESFEFANYMLTHDPDMISCSNAWLMSKEDGERTDIDLTRPSEDTLNYWCLRLSPLLEGTSNGKKMIVAISNRAGKEEKSSFVGSSCVLLFKDGEANLLGVMGINEIGVIVVDC
jgi:protein N-terminal amidase